MQQKQSTQSTNSTAYPTITAVFAAVTFGIFAKAEGIAEGIAKGIAEEKQNTERERKRADAAEARVKELEAMLAMKQ